MKFLVKVLFSVLLFLYVSNDAKGDIKVSKNPATASKPNEVTSPQKNIDGFKSYTIIDDIDYAYGYDHASEDAKFNPGLLTIVDKKTSRIIVLVNIHSDQELNTSSQYNPTKRTFAWGTPYEAALQKAMSALKHPHEQSALLKAWSRGELRKFVSFMIIPKDTVMTFKIGTASRQERKNEIQEGGGMQMRLKFLPRNSIVLTMPLTSTDKNLDNRTSFSLHNLLNEAIQEYNIGKNVEEQIPVSVLDVTIGIENNDPQSYVDQSFVEREIDQ